MSIFSRVIRDVKRNTKARLAKFKSEASGDASQTFNRLVQAIKKRGERDNSLEAIRKRKDKYEQNLGKADTGSTTVDEEKVTGIRVDEDTIRVGDQYYDLAVELDEEEPNVFDFDEDVSMESRVGILGFAIENALEDHFDFFGLATPAFSGTIKSIKSPTEVEVEEELSIDDVSPPIYKPFTIEYEVDKMIEIEGEENEEKDLIIGELEYIKEVYENRLEQLNVIAKLLAERLAGLLGGKYDDMANIDDLLLDKESTMTILDTATEDLNAVQTKINDLETQLAYTHSIHSHPAGCAQSEGYIFPEPINVYEFHNPYNLDYVYTKDLNFPQVWTDEAIGIGKLRLSTYTPNVHNTPDSEVSNREIRIQEIPEMVSLNGTSLFDIRPRGFNYQDMWPDNGPGGLPTENWTAVWEGYLEFPIATKEKNKSRVEQHGFLILSNVNDAYAMELQDRDGKWIRVNEGSWGGGSSDFAARTGVVPTTDNASNDQTNGLVRWLDGSGYPKDPTVEPHTEVYEAWNNVYLPINPDEKRVYPMRMYLCNGGGQGELKLWMKYTKEGKAYDAEYITSEAEVSDHMVLKHVTTTETNNLSDEIFVIPKHYFRLNAPELYELNGAPFSAYDPIEAANMELPNPVDVSIFQSATIVPEAPQATAGIHYNSHNASPPIDHAIATDNWTNLGIDFTATKNKLPVPHPDNFSKFDGVCDKMLRSVHRWKHKNGTFKYRILDDGRFRQARNTDKNSEDFGVLLYTEAPNSDGGIDQVPVQEQVPIAQNTMDTYEQDWTWEGIAWYAYESLGIPLNEPPEFNDISIKYYDEEFEDGNAGEGWFLGYNGEPDAYEYNGQLYKPAELPAGINALTDGVIPVHASGMAEWGATDKKYFIGVDAVDPDTYTKDVRTFEIRVLDSQTPQLVLDGTTPKIIISNYFGQNYDTNNGKLLYSGGPDEQAIYLPIGYTKLKLTVVDSRGARVDKIIGIDTHTSPVLSFEPMGFGTWNSKYGHNFGFKYKQQVVKGLKGYMTGTYQDTHRTRWGGYWAYILGYNESQARQTQWPDISLSQLMASIKNFNQFTNKAKQTSDTIPKTNAHGNAISGNSDSHLQGWMKTGNTIWRYLDPKQAMRPRKTLQRRRGHSPSKSWRTLMYNAHKEYMRGYLAGIKPWYQNEPGLSTYGGGRNTDYSDVPYAGPPKEFEWYEKVWNAHVVFFREAVDIITWGLYEEEREALLNAYIMADDDVIDDGASGKQYWEGG
tara:strand:+ start:457 stop:4173 length:3717 start_codon:yes stop_codon:yes gene_type:complete